MPHRLVFESNSEADTEEFGIRIADAIIPGIVVALDGQVGSGKTQLTRAICKGLGVKHELVNSPTFVLMQTYTSGRIPVMHFDTYRLGDIDEFLAIGAEEFLHDSNSLCLIEWAEIVAAVLPEDRLSICIDQTGPSTRRFTLMSNGSTSAEVLDALDAREA